LIKYRHLLSFDLTSYGAALSIVNRFVDGETVRDFELSPLGVEAQLILLASDAMALQLIKNESQSYLGSQVLESVLIENIHDDLLPVYLSQNKTALKKSLTVLEFSSVSKGFTAAQSLLLKGVSLVDFRVVRTAPKNVIITATAESTTACDFLMLTPMKKTVLTDLQPSLKSYYEILK
jgi:hypothetical protein